MEDSDIADEMGLAWEEIYELKRKFFDHEAELLRSRSTEHTYVKYAIEMRQCITDLKAVEKDSADQKNQSARVNAIKAQADVHKELMRTGLDLGLIKRISTGGLEAGQAIKEMSNVEFRKHIMTEVTEFHEMRMRFGDQGLLDLEPGPLHRSPVIKKVPVKGHVRTRVHGGRRVVKEDH
jgi:hypothetical protein